MRNFSEKINSPLLISVMLLMPGVMVLLRELSPVVNRQVYFTMSFYEMLGKKKIVRTKPVYFDSYFDICFLPSMRFFDHCTSSFKKFIMFLILK